MKSRISLAVAGIAVFCLASGATAQTCPDVSAPSITPPSAAGAKCLSAMAKNATKLVQTRLKVDGKCASKNLDHTACPSQKDTDKILKIASKGQDKGQHEVRVHVWSNGAAQVQRALTGCSSLSQ